MIVTLGNIIHRGDGSVRVAGSIYFSPLGAGGQTYVLKKRGGRWVIVGNTGSAWIS